MSRFVQEGIFGGKKIHRGRRHSWGQAEFFLYKKEEERTEIAWFWKTDFGIFTENKCNKVRERSASESGKKQTT